MSGRVSILASGSGTILDAIVTAGIRPAVVIVDRMCRAQTVAEAAGVPAVLIERTTFGPEFDRAGYTERVVEVLHEHRTDIVAMAGFMTVLAQPMFEAFPGRVVNTHPSLLPAFPGAHAVAEALAAGVESTGCTIHVATIDVDHGPVLAQQAVPVKAGDTVESLHERIKAVERHLYPIVIKELCAWT